MQYIYNIKSKKLTPNFYYINKEIRNLKALGFKKQQQILHIFCLFSRILMREV
jgi:hypothetical protein